MIRRAGNEGMAMTQAERRERARMKKELGGAIAIVMAMILFLGTKISAMAGYYETAEALIPVGGTGTFMLKEAGADDSAALDKITIDGSGEFRLSYTEPDTHQYEIFSKDANNADTRYEVTVAVMTETDSNKLTPNVAIADKKTQKKYPVAYYAITIVDPPIRKVVEGNPPTDETFNFVFSAVSTTAEGLQGNLPMPAGSSGQSKNFSLTGSGEVEVGEIVMAKAGTYKYECHEVPGSGNYKYDTSKYEVVYEIVEGPKSLEAKTTFYKDGVKVDKWEFEFHNVYERPSNGDKGGGTPPAPAKPEVTPEGSAAPVPAAGGISDATHTGDDSQMLTAGLVSLGALAGIAAWLVWWSKRRARNA